LGLHYFNAVTIISLARRHANPFVHKHTKRRRFVYAWPSGG
jgi:hypothetical protein